MKKEKKKIEVVVDEDTPNWLRSIQLNSWEAELLISALFLYILFQIPDYLDTYRKMSFSSDEIIYRMIGIFKDALRILSIGYVIHIISRGIWVANIGLSYVFPKGIDMTRVKLKGRFRKEVEKDTTLDHSVLQLERISSIVYAVSFMCSGLLLSFGVVIMTLVYYVEWALRPSIESGNGLYYGITLLLLLVYLLVILIVFIDFLTNGYFRRDSWASRPYYYIAIAFRYLTLSFIYNRVLLTILSNLPKWKAHLIPFLIIGFLAGYKWLDDEIDDHKREEYYAGSFQNMRYENFENLRVNEEKLFVTIQSEIVKDEVIRLFVNSLEEFSRLYARDSTRVTGWSALTPEEKRRYVGSYLLVKVDTTAFKGQKWLRFKHPVSLQYGYLTYLDVSEFPRGDHQLMVLLDTLAMQPRQIKYLRESKPSTVVQANIPFYLTK